MCVGEESRGEESRTKLGAAEREKIRVEETAKSDLTQLSEDIVQRQRRSEALDRDINRLRYLMSESEANLTWVRQEFEREDRETGLAAKHLSEDVRANVTAVEKAIREEFLGELIPLCDKKKDEYNHRQSMRANEDAAISKAIAILNKDSAFETFGKVSATSFMQLRSVHLHKADSDSEDSIRLKVKQLLSSNMVIAVPLQSMATAIIS